MKRSSFLASLAAMAVAPLVKTDVQARATTPPMPTFNRIALEKRKYYVISVDPIQDNSSAMDILRMYQETGTLVWKKEQGGEVEWKPIHMIQDGEV